MPRNCCVPLCTTNARKYPLIRYHEFPCDVERRKAWIKNISRQGTSGKGSIWEPSDRSLVCALHFTDGDYKKSTKLKFLLPTAVPTVFPNYPEYMRKENGQKQGRKRRRSGCGHVFDAQEEAVAHRKKLEQDTIVSASTSFSSDGDDQQHLVIESSTEKCSESVLLVDKACETTLNLVNVLDDAKRIEHRLKMKIKRQQEALQKLQAEHDAMRQRLQDYDQSKEIQDFVDLLKSADEGDKNALFIKNQVCNYCSKKPKYNETILRECVLWKACSSKGYEHVRIRNLFKLPCRATLQNYVGQSTGEIGVTTLIRERLRVEYEGLSVEQEAFCSLIIDEMAIDQKVIYDRQVDKIFGLVDMGTAEQSTSLPLVANRLLCFVLRGLSTAYIIPVGYFFTRCLKNDKLFSMTMEVMKAVEQVGFRVARVVTDNHQTNVSLFKRFSQDGTLVHAVPHPLRECDPLFLSFDPNHLIKNIRTNFLEREILDGEKVIRGGFYLKKLFDIQSSLLLKSVRFLTRSHVEPTNIEKMKVRRATQTMSSEVIATLQFLQQYPKCHPEALLFKDCGATICFMKMVAQWYALHDIGVVKPRGLQEGPFYSSDDERLCWLEVDFVGYLEYLQMNGGKSTQKMTKETYEATLMTTRSTVALTEYLLDHINFRYVLTRGLNSDPVESLFSSLRQFNGGNDRVDARAAVFTAEKLLKVGILQAAQSANAPTTSEMKTALKQAIVGDETAPLPDVINFATMELASELGFVKLWSGAEADLEIAPLIYLAGYLARVCEEKVRMHFILC
ncbi:uncharacterized protein LOC119445244 isoform X1 [Dermacentor silvarum]|uniref:uncharacterized protein LOC119445244 isoform X1 n=1 Tax=Dermacentor silvarum TaxID=543639 RepID=UPI002101A033|nr:uncharacterized protein LOC119445244 isoform X1 [Dermacentor silvarum]